MKVRNILLSGALCLLLCGPALIGVSDLLRLDLPSWLTSERAQMLSGDYRSDNHASFSLRSFLNGSFQECVEADVEGHIPMKADAMLGWSFVQRKMIEISNLAFGWQLYPTFYGSEILLSPTEGRLSESPGESRGVFLSRVEESIRELSAFCLEHPSLDIYVYLAPDSLIVDGSPMHELVSDSVSYSDIADVCVREGLGFTWIDGSVSYADFADGWYATDHHWSVVGAYTAAERILNALGEEAPIELLGAKSLYQGPPFRGTLARRGLVFEYADNIVDYELDSIPNFSVNVDGADADFSFLNDRESYEAGEWKQDPFVNHYAELFHYDWGLITLQNEDAESDRSILMVVDSYSNCVEPLLAAPFKTAYFLDPRLTSTTVDEMLNQHPDISDVVFFMRQTNLFSKDMNRVLQ